MFRKLVSNLPFNPGLLDNVSFYAARLRAENSIRRAGLIFMALAVILQLFAVAAPPERSVAASSNDIISGGVRTRDELLRAYDTPGSDVASVFTRFGITRQHLAALPQNPNATIRSNDYEWWSVGRTPLTGYSDIDQAFKNNDMPFTTNTGTTVYMRQLHAWDRGGASTYQAFKGTANGTTFWVLTDCGNLTFHTKPPLKEAKMEFKKFIVGGGNRTLKPGDTYSYRFEYRNSEQGSLPAENVIIEDWIELQYFDVVSWPSHHNLASGNHMTITIPGSVPYTSGWQSPGDLTVRLKQNIQGGQLVCNTATLYVNWKEVTKSGGKENCITAKTVVTPAVTTPKPKPAPKLDAALTHSKSAINITRNLDAAETIKTPARSGDVIEYTLSTQNSFSQDRTGYTITDTITDVLEYADLDTDFLRQNNGSYSSSSQTVKWANQTIKANTTDIKKFRVTIKKAVPATNQPNNMTTSYDCRISNRYGTEVTIPVDCPAPKVAETVVRELPKTGPGGVAVSFVGLSVVGYFVARGRLLRKELDLVRSDYASGGGQ